MTLGKKLFLSASFMTLRFFAKFEAQRVRPWSTKKSKKLRKKTNSKFSWLPSIKFGWNVCEQNACWLLKCQKVFYGSCRNFGKKIKFNLDLLSKRVIWSTVMLFEAYFFLFFSKTSTVKFNGDFRESSMSILWVKSSSLIRELMTSS